MYGSQLEADISSRGKLAMARDIFDEQGRSVLLLCNGFRPGAVEKHPSRHRIPPFSSTPNKKWSSPSSQLSWNRKTLLCQTANWPSSFEGLINASNSVIKMKCITFSFPRLPSMSDHSLSLASMIFINYDSFCNEVRSSKSENWVSIFFFFTKSQQQIEEKGLKISWPVSLSLPWSGSYILGNLFPIFYSSLGSSVLPRSHSCSSPG